jgi:cystathionine beta-synthase
MTTPAISSTGILDLIGQTPMIKINRIDTGPCELWVKMESQNPGGSIKDRIAAAMILDAEAKGQLLPGGTVVEATAGNTGLSLALVAAQKGYRLILVIPDKMAREKITHLQALGADVRLTRSDVAKGHPNYYQDMAARIAHETPGAFYINQFENPANPAAHFATTGPEIWAQMAGRVDAIVCGVGSGGTLTGLGRYFADISPSTAMVLADPKGSILAPLVNTGEMITPGSWAVEGVGEDFVPDILDLSLVTKAYTIPDPESFATARDLLRQEGILSGSSSGLLVAAALRYCREQTTPKRVVTFICDHGAKYLSKVFNPSWLVEQGFINRPKQGGVADLVIRRREDGQTVTVTAEDTLRIAYNRMRAADVSQLPVLAGRKVVGLLHESDLLTTLADHGLNAFSWPVGQAMVTRLSTLDVHADRLALPPIFAKDHVALITDGDDFVGIITRIDYINDLLRNPS